MFNGVFVTFPCGILGQMWYLIVLVPDLCPLLTSMWTVDSDDSFDGFEPQDVDDAETEKGPWRGLFGDG